MNDKHDKIQMDGVFSKGYGIIYKFVMTDPELPIEAKAIYAYFCACAGSGTTAFPSRSKVLNDLQISKNTYYKHFYCLLEVGYISVSQKEENGQFSNNTYTLHMNPNRFLNHKADVISIEKQTYSRVLMPSMASAGIGFLPRLILEDKNLSIKAKGIYAYFCAFAGTTGEAFPKRDVITYHLGMSEQSYGKHYKQLTSQGYITVSQRRVNGSFSVNDYYLNDSPFVEATFTKNAENTEISPIAEKWDTVKCDTEKWDTDLWNTENCDTTNNSNINNKNNNINPSIPEADRTIDNLSISEILEKALSGEPIPDSLLVDESKRIELVHAISEWDTFSQSKAWFGYDGTANHDVYIMAVNVIVDMLAPSNKPMHLAGSSVSYRRFADELCRHIQTGRYTSGDKYYTISEILMDVQGRYKYALKNYSIQNKNAYMKSIIWNQLVQGDSVLLEAL